MHLAIREQLTDLYFPLRIASPRKGNLQEFKSLVE